MPLWRACKLQTYFTAKGLIDYLLVEEDPSLPTTGGALAGSGLAMAPTSQEEGKLFEDLKADIIQASRDLDKEAEIVQDVEASRADAGSGRIVGKWWLGKVVPEASGEDYNDEEVKDF
ncbi:hypothetical protein ACHAO7_010767 [Fusarium culmorum]